MSMNEEQKSATSISLDSKSNEEELKEEQSVSDDSRAKFCSKVKQPPQQMKQSIKLFKMINGAIIEQSEENSPDVAKNDGTLTHDNPAIKKFQIEI
jgi:hypothetical protein